MDMQTIVEDNLDRQLAKLEQELKGLEDDDIIMESEDEEDEGISRNSDKFL